MVYRKGIIICIFLLLFSSKALSNTPPEDSKKFSFAVMGCMHLGVCGLEDYESAIEKIEKFKPDFVLFLGGMVDPSGDEPVESLWNKFDFVTRKLGIPVYNVPGICRLTIESSMPEDRKVIMGRCFMDRYKNRYYSFEYKNNLFIGLDSEELLEHIEQKKKSLTVTKQLDFLDKALANASKYDNIFIFLHNSPWFQDKANEWFKSVHPLIKEKVKFVFGSSAHYLDAKKIDGVTYVTTGSPCFLKRILQKPSFFHFLITDVDKDRVTIKIVPIKPFLIENLICSLIEKEYTLSTLESAYKQHETVKPYNLTGYEREAFLKPEGVIKALKIKPGMNILDIGAGAGFFTFRFAEALKGTGKVFATDIAPKMIEYMKKRVEENKYSNVFPIHVKSQTVDPFYKQHLFDIIFLCESFHYLRYPKDYFQELRPALSKEGRLYIIHTKNVFDFSEIEFEDFSHVIKILSSEGDNFPIFKKLSKDLQGFIRNWQGGDVPLEIKQSITRNFNKILLDKLLFYELMDYYSAKGLNLGEGEWSAPIEFVTDSVDQKLAKWLFVQLEANGVFNKKSLNALEKEQLRKLNRALLTKTFKIHKVIYLQGEIGPCIYTEKESIISTMESAGYKFVHEYAFLPYHYFLEFRRKY